ncbi:MAG TPA: A/G-specific adenine glycosylase, partial [Nitrospiria bacterium]|nr:A/G-specific adenine glycosylase [Nitrospiria bacterium]
MKPASPNITLLRKHLLAWYRKSRRDLPWRRTRDPYHILVSEIMLQQTQVDTVIPYYHRFLKAFPTVSKLSRAPERKVLKLWEGLGYYSRARNLHRAAKEVHSGFEGKVPDTLEKLESLPGIGRYTAGAVASIAFDRRTPIVDGNVKRVLCRLFAIEDDPAATSVKNRLWELAESLVPGKSPGDFNQALMEFGATLCRPRNPSCGECPV